MATRNYQSIGEVLVTVKTEFPDITISKIRFLESEGLIEPERTPSGYRKFYDKDLERLRSILKMQRDEYLPLKVIKERLLQQPGDGEVVDADIAEVAERALDGVEDLYAVARGHVEHAVGVAEGVGGGGRDDGDVDVQLAVLDRLPAAAVRAQHAQAAHLAGGRVLAEWTVHAALDVVHDAGIHVLDDGGMAGKRRTREPHEVLDAEGGGDLGMVAGGAAMIPTSIFSPVRPMPSSIAAERDFLRNACRAPVEVFSTSHRSRFGCAWSSSKMIPEALKPCFVDTRKGTAVNAPASCP